MWTKISSQISPLKNRSPKQLETCRKALAEGLAENRSLERIDLGGCRIATAGAQARDGGQTPVALRP